MARKLKCPGCGQQSAYEAGAWAADGRHYTQKRCSCGYEGRRKYQSLEVSKRLREMLAERNTTMPHSRESGRLGREIAEIKKGE